MGIMKKRRKGKIRMKRNKDNKMGNDEIIGYSEFCLATDHRKLAIYVLRRARFYPRLTKYKTQRGDVCYQITFSTRLLSSLCPRPLNVNSLGFAFDFFTHDLRP